VLIGDPALFAIVRLSLVVSLSAVLFASLRARESPLSRLYPFLFSPLSMIE
jgi:hypothetical protein